MTGIRPLRTAVVAVAAVLMLVGCLKSSPSSSAPSKYNTLADYKAAVSSGKPVVLELGAPW